uniref:RING-type E3 ubiquitin transferase n=2 Tax=Kalanchoe fedtschenkoi TaxID=63787 RepID=A0A7N0TJ17_KALFE
MSLLESRKVQIHPQRNLTSMQSSSGQGHLMADTDNPLPLLNHMPPIPKDFVCPITSQLFNDPVTLETGQTYERKAILEWLERGNSTCPITRHKLQSTHLPKTNYVLKRLIASWQDDHPASVVTDTAYVLPPEPETEVLLPAVSPNCVISQATIDDGTESELRHAIDNLCTCEILKESEMAVLTIERLWKTTTLDVEIQMMLSKSSVINGFVEILFNSVDPQVLKSTISLLTELGSKDKAVIQILTQIDSDVDDIITLFKKGLSEAVVLIYLLRPSFSALIDRDMVESLVTVIKKNEENFADMCLKPKTAAILLLAQIIRTNEETDTPFIVKIILRSKVIEKIAGSLESENSVERIAAVGILLRCMQCDGKCRNIIADKAELAQILESFMGASEADQSEIIKFLSELLRLNRRTFNEQILRIVKDEGSFSTMHSLLVYLQTAPQELTPVVAGLLLQLDLLKEPRKMSIYREEAIDSLISCLRSSEHPATQMLAAETIESLQGKFTSSGESLTRDLLLKRAGLDKSYKKKLRTEQLSTVTGETEETSEEEKAAEEWEQRMAFVLVSHEFGLLFEALAEGLKSRYTELRSSCFVSAIWLIHMLGTLPDTGVRGAARVCLLKRIMTVFNTARDIEDRALSLLALKSFTNDPEGMQDMSSYLKDLMKGLRELRKSSILACELLKLFSKGHDSKAIIWQHKEVIQVDCSANGEVLSIVSFKDRIFSGHSDGTIKAWTGRGSILHLIQQTREHSKAVTSLAVMPQGDKLYSGSLDKTTRVWSISNEVMECIQVHDMKEHVHNLAVAGTICCYIPQGAGVKVHSWNGGSRLFCPDKYMKCMVLVQGKLYCGCQDSSIQEIDLASGTVSTIQNGSRKLLTKSNPIQTLKVYDGLIYSASTPSDGSAVKVWNATSYNMVGSVASTQEIRAMAVSSDLIYLGCKGGIVEVWSREKYIKIETLQTGSNSKVMCMDLNSNEEVLVVGTSDGQIQAWALS